MLTITDDDVSGWRVMMEVGIGGLSHGIVDVKQILLRYSISEKAKESMAIASTTTAS